MTLRPVRHPAWQMPFDELVEGLRGQVRAGVVNELTGPAGETLFKYNKPCTLRGAWNPFTCIARGIVLDLKAKRIIGTPLPKFFNQGERQIFAPRDQPFEAFDKLDGSCGVMYQRHDSWRVITTWSFDAPQAVWAQKWMHENARLDELEAGMTPIFEIIYKANKQVVRYKNEGCVLTAAYDSEGFELETPELEALADRLGMKMAARYPIASIDELLQFVASRPGRDAEGCIARFANGLRVKFKSRDYHLQHLAISDLRPLTLWEAILSGVDLDKLRQDIDEEYWWDFDTIRSILTNKFAALIREVDAYHAQYGQLSPQELAHCRELPPHLARFIMERRKRGPDWMKQGKFRRLAMNTFRPEGNQLDGYTPSSLSLCSENVDS